MMLGAIQSQMLIGKRIKHWSPSDLFSNGAQGALWGPLPYYSDAAGTVEADWGDPVGFIPDASGNGNDWTQVTSTARPILGRVPVGGRRNLLLDSEYREGVWSSSEFLEVKDGGGGFWELNKLEGSHTQYRSKTISPLQGGEIVSVTVCLKAGTSSRADLMILSQPYNNGTTETVRARILQGPGTVTQTAGTRRVEGLSPSEETIVQITRALQIETGPPFIFYLYPAGVGTTSGSVFASRFQAETLENLEDYPTPYQRVGNEYDITEAGVPSVYYVRYDLADDVLPRDALLPAITDGTVILIGQQGIWIDEGYSFAGGVWSFGPTTYADGPVGIIGVVGDMLDLVVLDRPLTVDERDKVVAYGVKRGSAGEIRAVRLEDGSGYLLTEDDNIIYTEAS